MPVKVEEKGNGKILEVRVSGKLVHEDYQRFVPKFDRLVKRHGKIRLLFEMNDFHGWELQAAWDDLRLGMKHFADIERIAMVGDQNWEKWMAAFCQPFTKAEVRYFESDAVGQARNWLKTD
jgi:SpoIIAA-like